MAWLVHKALLAASVVVALVKVAHTVDNTTQLDKEDRQSKIGTVAAEEEKTEDAEGEE